MLHILTSYCVRPHLLDRSEKTKAYEMEGKEKAFVIAITSSVAFVWFMCVMYGVLKFIRLDEKPWKKRVREVDLSVSGDEDIRRNSVCEFLGPVTEMAWELTTWKLRLECGAQILFNCMV